MRALELAWESAGTDEPGDQNADSEHGPHAFWSLGPESNGEWRVGLTVRDEALMEVDSDCIDLGAFATEAAAKAAAAEWEAAHCSKHMDAAVRTAEQAGVIYNVRVSVVELVRATSPEHAYALVAERLSAAGFDVYDGNRREEIAGAFVSDDQSPL